MKQRFALVALALAAAVLPALDGSVVAQQAPQQQQPGRPNDGVQVGVPQGSAAEQAREQQRQAARKQAPLRPTPRTPDGRVILGATKEEVGLWLPGAVVGNPLGFKDVPYQPWAKELAADRRRHQLEPHTRCKPSGVARVFLTPYGVEMLEVPELKQVFIFDVGGPHSYRTVFMDGRTHPKDRIPDYYGHSIGWWEGDTLAVETTSFNEGFWFDRGQSPHTDMLRTLERFTRTAFENMRYELTIDDPGAYTAPFTGVVTLRWEKDTELFEFQCQQANYAHELMVGQYQSVDRSTPIVP